MRVFTGALLGVLAGCTSVQPAQQNAGQSAAQIAADWPAAPEFDLPTVTGSEVVLSELRGQVVVLHFWAKWCSSCEGDLEAFEELHEKYSENGVSVVGIAHASGFDEQVAMYTDALGVDFPNIQANDELRAAYGAAVFPTTVVVDQKGRIRDRTSARVDPRYWDRVVAELLKEARS